MDENQKTHETERLIHDGYEEIEHVSTQESKGEDGKKRKGKTKGTLFQPNEAVAELTPLDGEGVELFLSAEDAHGEWS